MSTPLPGRAARPADATGLFGLFAAAFAVSLILHQLWWFGFEVLSPHFVVVVAALWTILRPTSVRRFLAMISAEVVSVALDMPDVGSHTLLVLVSCACVLTYAGWTTARSRRLPEPGALFERIAPFLRAQLLVVYAAAAIAKMNTAFFDADVSCAAALSAKVAWFDPSLLEGAWRVAPSIYGTVAVEVALPLLLAVRRTRLLGLALGGAFHTILAMAGNVPFSALGLALYVAFLPADTPSRLRAVAARRAGPARWAQRTRRSAGSRLVLPALIGGWLAATAILSSEPAVGRALISNGTRMVLVALALCGGAVLALALRRGGPSVYSSGSVRPWHPVFVVGILLLVVNSLSPYLGLKTESSFTMFSNLQTERGAWNHALIPEAVRVFGYQDELVRVSGSNDPALARRTDGGSRVVRFELERYVRSHPGTTATYLPAAVDGRVARATSAESAGSPATPILDRVVKFRDVRAPERRGC